MFVKNVKTGEVKEVTIFDTRKAVDITHRYADSYFDLEEINPKIDDNDNLLIDDSLFSDFIKTMESIQDMIRSYYDAKEESFNGDKIDEAFEEVHNDDEITVRDMAECFEEMLWMIEEEEEEEDDERKN